MPYLNNDLVVLDVSTKYIRAYQAVRNVQDYVYEIALDPSNDCRYFRFNSSEPWSDLAQLEWGGDQLNRLYDSLREFKEGEKLFETGLQLEMA